MNNPNDITRLKHLDSVLGNFSERVPAPTAGDADKFLRGDGTWATPVLSGGGSSIVVAGGTILDTVSSTVDGGLWYEVTDDVPAIWLRKGNYEFEFLPNANLRYKASNTYLKAYLPFDTSPTADVCGNVWTIFPAYNAITPPLQIDRNVKKFGASSLRIPDAAYGLRADAIININAEKWTFDGWYYRDTSETSFQLGLENSHTYEKTGITILYDFIYVPNATNKRSTFWATDAFALGEWTHVAIVKNGSNLLFFKNGQLDETLTLTGSFATGGGFELGYVGGYVGHLAHYDRLRFYEGVARWAENFTPPTAADYDALTLALDSGSKSKSSSKQSAVIEEPEEDIQGGVSTSTDLLNESISGISSINPAVAFAYSNAYALSGLSLPQL